MTPLRIETNFLRIAIILFCVLDLRVLYFLLFNFFMATFFRDALLVQLDPPRVEAGNLRVADGQIVGVGSEVVASAR